MSSYILFLILGLGSGATYAILGQGLVLKYRSAGVVDFAHGAVAMFIAYVFVNLRSFGELELPVVLIPHQISLNGGTGLNTGLAIVRRFHNLDPSAVPAVLVAGHAPFCWGKTVTDAAHMAVIVEEIAAMAWQTVTINPHAAAIAAHIFAAYARASPNAGGATQ